MIYSVKFNNYKKTPFPYLGYLKFFSTHKEFNFKTGMNLIIGPNGSGKSTLLKTIQHYFAELDTRVPFIGQYFHLSQYNNKLEGNPCFYNGVDIEAAFGTPVFSLHNGHNESNEQDIESIVNKIEANHHSDGEKKKINFNNFFATCYHELENDNFSKRIGSRYQNPLEMMSKTMKSCNDTWADVVREQNEWYIKNDRTDDIPTFILDEPEANMDITSCIDTGKLFTEIANNEMVQYIMVVHDPYIIKKIKDTGKANIIELHPHYLDCIDEYFNI